MKLFLCTLFPFIALGQNNIEYKVFFDSQLAAKGLKVQVSWHPETRSDSTVFYYSNTVWNERNLFNCLKILKEDNPGLQFRTVPAQNQVIIYHSPGKSISFSYRIMQDYEGESYTIINRPRIKDRYFHVLGESLFIIPWHLKAPDAVIDATIDWIGFPEYFRIHNTFATNIKHQAIKTTIRGGFYHSLFVGGDYRVYEFRHRDKPVYLAIREQWYNGLSDEFLLANLEKTIISQRDFWKDHETGYFTVIMTPTVSQADSLLKGQRNNGAALANGFMIQMTNNFFNDKNAYLYILNHELMHYWIGGKIANKYLELNYWFSEGFTDYYNYKNRLRNNYINYDEWLQSFNKRVIADHWKSPEKNVPNYVIKDSFWLKRGIEKLPYRRGAIFAFWLDNQILRKSNYTRSLDDLMRELLARCTTTNTKFSDELLIDLANNHLSENIARFFQKHIINGEDIDLLNEKWIDGFEFEKVDNIPQLKLTKDNIDKYIIDRPVQK